MFKTIKWKMMFPILIAVVFIIGGFSTFIFGTMKNNINEQSEGLVTSIKLGLEGAILSRDVSEQIMEQEMIAQSVLISWILERGGTYEDLKALANKGGIDEIWSTDATGQTTVTSIAPSVDFNFSSDPNGQAYEYMQLVNGGAEQITQPAQIRDVDGEFYKFVGVNSWDPANPKIIQVARNGQMLVELEEQIGKEFYMNALHQNLNETVLYAAVVDANGEVLAATSETALNEIGYKKEQFETTSMVSERTTYDGKRSMNYVVPLANDTYLAITISNSVLTVVTIATIIAALIAVAIIMGIIDFTIMKQVRRITSVRDSLNDISEGAADLTKRIELRSRDEIGQLVTASNGMMDNFQRIMIELQSRADTIQEASKEIHKSATHTKQSTLEIQCEAVGVANDSKTQLKSIEDSALALEDLAKGIQHITESIMEVSNISNDTEKKALTGVEVVEKLQTQLQNLSNQTDRSVERTKELVKLSDLIGDFTNVITGISDQTNLLALNASIEAARAGESGKGFAVVAEEVRKLAEESKVAAERISTVVTDVQRETVQIVDAITVTSDVLKQGRSVANEAQHSFKQITEGVRIIADQVDLVSSASEEMAASTEEISASFEDVSNLSKNITERIQTVASHTDDQVNAVNEMTNAIDSLFVVSNELNDTTHRYKL